MYRIRRANVAISSTIIYFQLLCSVINISVRATEDQSGISCKIVFENAQLASNETSAVVQMCLNNFPMTAPNRTATDEEKMEIDKTNDHNCAMKCINDNLNVTTEDGRVDVSKILGHFQNSNATAKYVKTLALMLGGCDKEIEQKMQSNEDDTESYLCKYHVMFMRCYRDAYMTAHSEMNKMHRIKDVIRQRDDHGKLNEPSSLSEL